MQHFTREQLKMARGKNLYEFLKKEHSDLFISVGTSIRPRNNRSISIKSGYCGYMDFENGETGNSVDFLVRHMNYELDQAVFALCGETISPVRHIDDVSLKVDKLPPVFPNPVKGRYKNLFAYLMKRSISPETIKMLIDDGIIYQEVEHNNIVFINKERNWGEIRGTYDLNDTTFKHGIVSNSRVDGFWWFRTAEHPIKAYICEAAIDAISLYEIQQIESIKEPTLYISIGGVGKQRAIDRIKRHKIRTILAVDNDEAGANCRNRNSELEYLLPTHKDWNEDLQKLKKG